MTESSSPPNARPKPFRRWLQFRLLTLLAVMTICSIWFGTAASQARRQREAVQAVQKLGGQVRYDYERPDPKLTHHFDPKRRPPGPTWLRRLLGDEYFVEVVRVDLSNTNATDADLALLENLPKLENLNLGGTAVTSAGMQYVGQCQRLEHLVLWKTDVDDAGLEKIRHLKRMKQIVLDETRISDAGLKHLERMTELEYWLGLVGTDVSDEGLESLKGLTKLRNLNLLKTRVTAEGAKRLQQSLPAADISYNR